MSEDRDLEFSASAPVVSGDAKLLPQRQGRRGLLPSTWRDRLLKVSYTGADGKGVDTSGVLLDWSGFGPVLLVAGARTVIGWDRIAVIELDGN